MGSMEGHSHVEKATGPLRVHPTNPRYFTDGSGRAVYLTGSHTWHNLQDRGLPRSPPFDYAAYLDFLQEHHHNFIRLWAWEGAVSDVAGPHQRVFEPMPYRRTGPGTALDGRPKFDLEQWEPAYFDRLRARVRAAGDRGIYVSIMLFQGWSIERKKSHRESPWFAHPCHRENNVNGIDGDANGNGEGEEVHTLAVPAVTRLQEAYVRQVVDTVNDLDNVLYEITNESPITTQEWQYHLVRFVHQYEASQPQQHPVGMTYFYGGRAGAMEALLASPAEWISPGNDHHEATRQPTYRYHDDPPPADGRKVILSDTDHFFGVGGNGVWVWKTFTRGLNPLYMDPLDQPWEGATPEMLQEARKALGQTRRLAERMNLADLTPHQELASTQYCLAHPGQEYLVYLPDGGEVTVDLSAAAGPLAVEWMPPVEGVLTPGGTAEGGAARTFTAPFAGDAVLVLRRQ